jgi:hypothetical protein
MSYPLGYAGMKIDIEDFFSNREEEIEKEAEAARLAKEKAEKAESEKTDKQSAEEAKASSSTGGNKKVKDKYTVKELKAIASRNNIKTTKKLNGKTVPLNKKGLFAKLKRNKVI